MAIAFRLPSLSVTAEDLPLADRSWIHAVIFGASGLGKTPFAAQFPRPLFLMADRNGENSLLRTQTPYVPVRSVEDFDKVLQELRDEQFNPNRQFDTIVLDTISVFQDHVATNMLERLGLKNMDSFKNWGELESEVKTRISRLQSLAYNIVILCHVNEVFGAEEREVEPLMKGNLKKSLTREFPFVFGLQRRKEMVLDEGAVQAEPRDVLYAVAQPSTMYPMARTPDRALPPEFKVTFSPADYEVIASSLEAKASALSSQAAIRPELLQPVAPARPVTPPVQQAAPAQPAAPAQAPATPPAPQPATSTTPAGANSGPVGIATNASVDRLAARGAKAQAVDAAVEAEQTLEAAVDTATEALGATEIPLWDRLRAVQAKSQATALYLESQAQWEPEMTAYVQGRVKNEPDFANN